MNLLNQNYMKFALLLCAITIVCLSYMELSGNNDSFGTETIFGWIMFGSPLVIWPLGIYSYKRSLRGSIRFKEAFMEGFRIALAFGIISPFIFLGYYFLFNWAILEYVKASYNMPQAADTTILVTDMVTQFLTSVIMGSIISAVAALFLRSGNK